jgi:hypothetical protein
MFSTQKPIQPSQAIAPKRDAADGEEKLRSLQRDYDELSNRYNVLEKAREQGNETKKDS